jgi:Neuraminidase (sialidase)
VYADPNGNSSGKSYVVFGKANNSAINLSDIANANNPTGGFVINEKNFRNGSLIALFRLLKIHKFVIAH